MLGVIGITYIHPCRHSSSLRPSKSLGVQMQQVEMWPPWSLTCKDIKGIKDIYDVILINFFPPKLFFIEFEKYIDFLMLVNMTFKCSIFLYRKLTKKDGIFNFSFTWFFSFLSRVSIFHYALKHAHDMPRLYRVWNVKFRPTLGRKRSIRTFYCQNMYCPFYRFKVQ